MVSKNYIPINEKSIRARERDQSIKNDPELQKDFIRVSAKLGGCFNQTIIEKLRGKDLFIQYMNMSPTDIEKLSKEEWERIETVLRETDEKTKMTWVEEWEDSQ